MSMARALDYDDLHGWLDDHAADADSMARDLEDEDESSRRFYAGRLSAFTDLLAHIESELSYGTRR